MADQVDGHLVPPRLYRILLRVAAAFEAGLLTNRPPREDRRGGPGGGKVYVGKALTKIEKGGWGWITRVRGKPAIAEVEPLEGQDAPAPEDSTEEAVGLPLLAYSYYGKVRPDGRVQYVRHNGYVEVIQAPC